MRRLAPPPILVTLPSSRTPPLALRNVMHGGFRSVLAIAGVGFSITLVLLQLGFLEAVRVTATTVFDQLEFDVALISPEYEQFFGPGSFPLNRLKESASDPDVLAARPLYALMTFWRCPPYPLEPSAHGNPEGPVAEGELGVVQRAGGSAAGDRGRSRSESSWSWASTRRTTRSAHRFATRSRPPGRVSGLATVCC